MPRGKHISEEEYNRLHKLHTSGLSLSKLSDKENIPYNTLYYGFKRRDMKVIKHYDNHRTYEINEKYFSNIDSSDKAYFLGLIIADGFILPQKAKGVLSIKLKKSDSYILEDFRDLINPKKPLYEDDSNSKILNRDVESENSVRLSVNSEKILNDLRSYGIVKNKSGKEVLPDLNEEYNNHLIRGIFDGDGSIGFRSSRPNQRQVYICSSSQGFCNSIKDLLLDNSINTRVYEEVRDEWNNIYRVTFSTHKSRVGFYKYIYQDADYFLDRKYEKYQKYVNTVVSESSNELSLP